MAPKRSSLLEDPPAASSSEEEVETEDEEEEEEVEEETVVEGAGDDDDESESDDVEGETPKKLNPASSDSEDDDEEGDESDSDESPQKPSDNYRTSTHIVKPSQPPSQPKKSVAKPTPAAATSAAPKTQATGKRPLEAEKAEKEKEKESKRKKKKVEGEDDDDSVPEEGEKDHKNPFQRLWSDDDELVILKGMTDCIKKGIDPTSDLDEFLDSIKKSIHVSVNKDQLTNKIRRLKQKYKNSLKRVKEGEDPTFTKPHDIRCYELMKELWAGSEGKSKKGAEASNGNDDSVVSNGKRSRKATSKSGAASSPKPKTVALADIPIKDSPKFEDKNSSSYPCLNVSVQSANISTLMGGSLYKEGLALLGDAKAKELDQKWRKLQTAELENHLKRIDLEREQILAVLNALKASDS